MKNLLLITLSLAITVITVKGQELSWINQFGGNAFDVGKAITIDSLGYIYTAGKFEATVDFATGDSSFSMTSNGYSDVYICKLDTSGNLIWARQIGGPDSEYAQSIAVDKAGNIYTLGQFMDTVDFDPGEGVFEITAYSSWDIFISKLDSSGNFVWAKRLGALSNNNAYSIAVDDSSNVYTSGKLFGTIDLDPGAGIYELTSNGDNDVFICKLDSNGNFVWATSFGGSGHDHGFSIAVDQFSNVYTAGRFQETVDFDPGVESENLSSFGENDVFISKLDASGNYVWAKQMGGDSLDVARSIAIDTESNVYTSGFFDGTADFDPGSGTFNLSPAGFRDTFISALDSSGNFLWAKQFESSGWVNSFNITVDDASNTYTTGSFAGTVDFDPGEETHTISTSFENEKTYISKLNSSGEYEWVVQLHGNSNIASIAVDKNSNIYTAGNLIDTVDFDPGSEIFNLISQSVGFPDAYALKLNQQNATSIYPPSATDNKRDSLIIWPNPTTSTLRINSNSITITDAVILDAAGNTLSTPEVHNGEIDISSLPSGSYFLHLISKDRRIIVRKILKL